MCVCLTGGGGRGGAPEGAADAEPMPPPAVAEPSTLPGAAANSVWTLNLLGLFAARRRSA